MSSSDYYACCLNKEFYFHIILSSGNVLKYIKPFLYLELRLNVIQLESTMSRKARLAPGKGTQSTCYVPGSGTGSLESSHTSSHPPKHMLLSPFLQRKKTEGQRSEVTCPRSSG